MSDFPEVPPGAPEVPTAPAPLDRRVAGWQLADAMRCPQGHLITRRDTFLSGTLVARCECGRAMLAIAAANLLTSGSPPERLVYSIEVTKLEASWIARARPSLHELLDRYGVLLGAPPGSAISAGRR
jgi:hypothetical protein